MSSPIWSSELKNPSSELMWPSGPRPPKPNAGFMSFISRWLLLKLFSYFLEPLEDDADTPGPLGPPSVEEAVVRWLRGAEPLSRMRSLRGGTPELLLGGARRGPRAGGPPDLPANAVKGWGAEKAVCSERLRIVSPGGAEWGVWKKSISIHLRALISLSIFSVERSRRRCPSSPSFVVSDRSGGSLPSW
jgi:hypothetical protein